MKKLPAEIVASALAVTTIFITLLPYHLWGTAGITSLDEVMFPYMLGKGGTVYEQFKSRQLELNP